MVLFCRLRTAIVILGFNALIKAQNREQAPLVAVADNSTCEQPSYQVHIFSTSPLVIYLTDFISPSERQQLQSLAADTFTKSSVVDADGHASHHAVRSSESTALPPSELVDCLHQRALAFQGLDAAAAARLEPLQLVRYSAGGHYHFHTDWFTSPSQATASQGGNRATSFFAYVSVGEGTIGGGTSFPLLEAPREGTWCRWVDCDAERDKGAVFRPIEGSAVFWENLGKDGAGDVRTLHAGEPVVMGSKIGMNIWTRQAALRDAIRSGKP
ncbi:hypothetical protein VD0002_g525 [Verticillium dahliae]|uniref:Oxidoreductase n=2 Tax=Verticillium dahliae TaxID=27337 RepID=G2XBW0_VERDV|nr:oxidoreductase [Verticillium dahliae VdLs.17]KAF3349482.1 Zinc finger protein 76 [Verticillium dahliae VDG2]KAH6699230.1 oxidoreductase [Verticillium dahliae]EGY16478.1 oxidoreductase [Verticillium dahliae VdLs.17]PNH32770.1 hypothetical protein BJF96_g3985 [Verticillium dahliae]PNH57248.1 hypothetical protein VD0003_g541 [Verticillium dahliae]